MGRRRNILLVNPWHGLIGPNRGAAELVREAAARGHEMHVASGWAEDGDILPRDARRHVLADLRLQPMSVNPLGRLRKDWRAGKRLGALARQIAADVIVVNTESLLFAPRAGRLAGRPVAVIARGMRLETSPLGHVFFRLQRRWVDRYIAILSGSIEPLRRRGVPADAITFIPNGVDTEVFSPGPRDAALARELGLRPDGPVVGTVTHLSPRKGAHHLVEAVARLVQRVPEVQCVIVGGVVANETHDYAERVRRRVRELGLERHVVLAGRRPDVPRLLSLFDVFVLPSETEACPRSALEAQACGLPVVGFRVGGMPEVVEDGKSGRLVEPFDTEALAACVADLLADPEERRRLGEAGRARVQAVYDVRRNVGRMIDELEALADRLPPRAECRCGAVAAGSAPVTDAGRTATSRQGRSGLHVVMVTMTLRGGWGGPPRSNKGLSEHLAAAGCKVDLCTLELDEAFGEPVAIDESKVTVHTARPLGWGDRALWAPRFRRMLREVAADADILQSEGMWHPMCHDAAVVARELGLPRVLSLRGEARPWAVGNLSLRKRLVKRLWSGRDLGDAACFHALTRAELNDIRACGLRNPVAVVPNGVDIEAFRELPGREVAGETWPAVRGKRLALFIGRLHPIKGLPDLLEAWSRLPDRFNEWHLVLAGPDERGHRAELEALIRQKGLAQRVTFTGPVWGDGKRALMGAAEVFCMASRSEGFSMGLLEALACGLPVLITSGCNFEEVVACGAGRIVDPGPDTLAAGLEDLLGLPDAERQEMGRRARRLVAEDYTWPRVAAKMIRTYEWLLGRAERPDFVDVLEDRT